MKLPDFNEFEPFNRLRQLMNATELGYFELFNPIYHLTGVERSELDQKGLVVSAAAVHHLLDFTLVYKNSRVWLESDQCFHLAKCEQLRVENQTVRIGTSIRALSKPLAVCRGCLRTLQYQGFDDQKARKEAYSQQVFEKFRLERFWTQFHLYPVSEKRDLRKAINH